MNTFPMFIATVCAFFSAVLLALVAVKVIFRDGIRRENEQPVQAAVEPTAEELFDYLCWLETVNQDEDILGAQFLVINSKGKQCWGPTYERAVRVAYHRDREVYEATKDIDRDCRNVRRVRL